jgi:hypothetical protein
VIEKNIYPRVYPAVLCMFKAQTAECDHLFLEKQRKTLKLSPEQLLTALQVSEKYTLKGCKDPYHEAKAVLARFPRLSTPLDKINCLIATVACMKSNVIDHSKAMVEIQAMDDELPILMFLLLSSSPPSPSAEFSLLSAYLHNRLENEARILLNFSSAVFYIAYHFSV